MMDAREELEPAMFLSQRSIDISEIFPGKPWRLRGASSPKVQKYPTVSLGSPLKLLWRSVWPQRRAQILPCVCYGK